MKYQKINNPYSTLKFHFFRKESSKSFRKDLIFMKNIVVYIYISKNIRKSNVKTNIELYYFF